MIVLEFPPSESFRSHVRTESRYGIKGCNKKKQKKISVKTPTISSHEYIMCSLRTPLHDIWFDSGVTTTTTYEWNEDPPAPSRWMNAEWAVIIPRKNGAKIRENTIHFFLQKWAFSSSKYVNFRLWVALCKITKIHLKWHSFSILGALWAKKLGPLTKKYLHTYFVLQNFSSFGALQLCKLWVYSKYT